MSADMQPPSVSGQAAGPERERRRAVVVLGGVAALIILLLVGLVAFLLGALNNDDDPEGTAPGVQPPPAAAPLDESGWDIAAQTELATRPMLELPEAAGFPHVLTSETAGPPIELPEPGVTADRVVAGGYPGTPEGAVAQLVELTRVGLEGGDPEGYRRAYEAVSLSDSPPPESTFLYRDLEGVRRGVFPATGAVPGLLFTWTPTSALVKGTTDDGRYAVVCVLGELVAGANGQSIASGAGDCQAMRYVDGEWRISPGALAARASLAWPGSIEAVNAGYRDVR